MVIRSGGDQMNQFDDDVVLSSVAGSATVTLLTKTGHGSATLNLAGDGHVDVDISYNVDGGGDTVADKSDQRGTVTIGFSTSLVIRAINNNVGSQNHTAISLTGTIR